MKIMSKFEELSSFVDRAVKSHKYPPNTGISLKTGLKLFEKELNEEEKASIDEFRKNLDLISNNIFSKGKFSAGSLATYKSRIIKVINDYEEYGLDAAKMASWSPRISTRVKKATDNIKNLKEKVSSAIEVNDSSAFVFPFTGGVKLIIPKTPEANDAIMDGELKNIKVALKDFSEKFCKQEDLPEETKE